MFIAEKSRGVKFVTDFRRLSLQIQRRPYPLPVTKEVLHRMEGFTQATCLDVNVGHYHALLDKSIQEICSIMPWGKHCYIRLPQCLNCLPTRFRKKWIAFSLT